MKSLLKICISAFSIALFTSCIRNDNFNTTTTVTGTYHALSYFNDKDISSDLTGYNFKFIKGGELKAVRGNTTIIGMWSERNGRFNIVFPAGTLEDLNRSWLVVQRTPDGIQLKNDDTSKVDVVTFSRF